MARVGLLKNFEAALVSSFKQSRNIHTVCSSCCRTRLPVSVSVVPHRYMRKLYPPIMDPTMIGDIQPEENTGIQLDYTPVLGNKGPELMEKIENVCVSNGLGRLFAVVHINKEQRKITTEDILVINGFFPPQIGDRIRLEKALDMMRCRPENTNIDRGGAEPTSHHVQCLNSQQSQNLVKIEATVIEKTLSNIRVHFEKVKKYQRFKLLQNPQTVIVINSIELDPFALSKQQQHQESVTDRSAS